jgi:hypothetical protein
MRAFNVEQWAAGRWQAEDDFILIGMAPCTALLKHVNAFWHKECKYRAYCPHSPEHLLNSESQNHSVICL